MAEDNQAPVDTDPSGSAGITEHPPIHSDEGARRMLVSEIWGGTPAFVLTEHGMDVHSWNPDCSWYDYGRAYCLNGCQHPGMDISLDFGTELFAAEGGKVVFAGPDRYYEPMHVNIETADGEVHIYGHMSQVSVSHGSRVASGQSIGRSGFSNSNHLHFERRVPRSGCSSGYAALDPEPVAANAGAAVTTPAFSKGDRIRVVSPPLRFRTAPGLDAKIIEELGGDVELVVVSGPRNADGYDWYEVTKADDDSKGWLAGRFCDTVST